MDLGRHEVICSSCQTPGAARLPVNSRNRPRGGAAPKPSKASAEPFPTAQNARSASSGTSASTARRGPIGNATSHDRYGLPSGHSAYGTHCQPVRFMVTPTSASVNTTVSDPASRRHSPPSRPQRSTGVERIHTARLLSMNGSSTSIDAVHRHPGGPVPHRYASTTTPAVAPPARAEPFPDPVEPGVPVTGHTHHYRMVDDRLRRRTGHPVDAQLDRLCRRRVCSTIEASQRRPRPALPNAEHRERGLSRARDAFTEVGRCEGSSPAGVRVGWHARDARSTPFAS